MIKVLTFGPNRDYQEIDTSVERITKEIQALAGTHDAEKFIRSLAMPNFISPHDCRNYGGTYNFSVTSNNNIPDEIADFFKQVREQGVQKGADYAFIQNLKFDIAGRMGSSVSADITLLLED